MDREYGSDGRPMPGQATQQGSKRSAAAPQAARHHRARASLIALLALAAVAIPVYMKYGRQATPQQAPLTSAAPARPAAEVWLSPSGVARAGEQALVPGTPAAEALVPAAPPAQPTFGSGMLSQQSAADASGLPSALMGAVITGSPALDNAPVEPVAPKP